MLQILIVIEHYTSFSSVIFLSVIVFWGPWFIAEYESSAVHYVNCLKNCKACRDNALDIKFCLFFLYNICYKCCFPSSDPDMGLYIILKSSLNMSNLN
jgi:hypothetical protein